VKDDIGRKEGKNTHTHTHTYIYHIGLVILEEEKKEGRTKGRTLEGRTGRKDEKAFFQLMTSFSFSENSIWGKVQVMTFSASFLHTIFQNETAALSLTVITLTVGVCFLNTKIKSSSI
jgi:hypothetical protein